MKYYRVTVLRGHQGKGREAFVTFYISANSAAHACSIAKSMPGVKHGQMAYSCISISYSEYMEGRKISAYKRANTYREW